MQSAISVSKKIGHFSSNAWARELINDVTSQLQEGDLSYLTAVKCENKLCWTVNILILLMVTKVDTGVEVTEITEVALTQYNYTQQCRPDSKSLKVLHQTRVTLSYKWKGNPAKHDVYEVKQLKHNLLGLQVMLSIDQIIQKSFSNMWNLIRHCWCVIGECISWEFWSH